MSEGSGDDLQKPVKIMKKFDNDTVSGDRTECVKYYNYARDTVLGKKTASKSTQANLDRYIRDNELRNKEPSKKFWQMVAEKRRIALSKALSDNEELHKCIDALTEANSQYKDKLDEATSFIEVCKGLLDEDGDDTGIDVEDMSECIDSTEN